jgi:RP/EB family microtubule-associated protein
LGSGAVYCQVIDVIHSGAVNMAKVNWKAKNDYEFIQNLRILQDAFKKIGIKRYV